jgi:hypothetical protein
MRLSTALGPGSPRPRPVERCAVATQAANLECVGPSASPEGRPWTRLGRRHVNPVGRTWPAPAERADATQLSGASEGTKSPKAVSPATVAGRAIKQPGAMPPSTPYTLLTGAPRSADWRIGAPETPLPEATRRVVGRPVRQPSASACRRTTYGRPGAFHRTCLELAAGGGGRGHDCRVSSYPAAAGLI